MLLIYGPAKSAAHINIVEGRFRSVEANIVKTELGGYRQLEMEGVTLVINCVNVVQVDRNDVNLPRLIQGHRIGSSKRKNDAPEFGWVAVVDLASLQN